MTEHASASGARGETRTTRAPEADDRFAVTLHGLDVDAQTRCAHWHGPTDIVALRFACCGAYSPCRACHDATAGHPAEVWPRSRFDEPAALCGACQTPLAASTYLASGHACPACGAAFNPGCAAHRDLYLEPLAPEARATPRRP